MATDILLFSLYSMSLAPQGVSRAGSDSESIQTYDTMAQGQETKTPYMTRRRPAQYYNRLSNYHGW